MKCWFLALLLVSLAVASYHNQCLVQEKVHVKQCIQMVTEAADIENKTIGQLRQICTSGWKCFDQVDCEDSHRARQTLRAGCDYEIFLLTKFKGCLEIIKTQSNCNNLDFNTTRYHCDIFKTMYQCVLPVIRNQCGSEKLAQKFRQKYLLHNKLSFGCGRLE